MYKYMIRPVQDITPAAQRNFTISWKQYIV